MSFAFGSLRRRTTPWQIKANQIYRRRVALRNPTIHVPYIPYTYIRLQIYTPKRTILSRTILSSITHLCKYSTNAKPYDIHAVHIVSYIWCISENEVFTVQSWVPISKDSATTPFALSRQSCFSLRDLCNPWTNKSSQALLLQRKTRESLHKRVIWFHEVKHRIMGKRAVKWWIIGLLMKGELSRSLCIFLENPKIPAVFKSGLELA